MFDGLVLNHDPLESADLVVCQPRIKLKKSGDEVVFVIQNGEKTHTIAKMTNPRAAARKTFTTSTGQFRDYLESDTDIAYYRID